jgi:histidinol phosphatase-like PHP family hydrolase
LAALDRHHEKIDCLGHIAKKRYASYIDIDRIVDRANQYNIAFELNCCNLINNKTNLETLDRMLSRANQIYINSDAHCLYELKEARKV